METIHISLMAKNLDHLLFIITAGYKIKNSPTHQITNDLNQDMELEEALVTKDGIMKDNQAQCQALMARIAIEIDMNLENLDGLKGVIMPDRKIKDQKYNRSFNDTAR